MAYRSRGSIGLRVRMTALVAMILLTRSAVYGADPPITVALIFDGLTQEEREPLRAYLTKAMGRPVKLAAPDLYSDTVAHLADGTYDFACLGALIYIRAHAKYGVIPLVRRSSDLNYHSVFITGAGSAIHSLGDLRGKQFAFGDINAASTRLIGYRELTQAGINPESDLQIRYSGSHVATAAMVQAGVVDAGALDETIFGSLISEGKLDPSRVRVFHTSESFVSYVYVARTDVPEAERAEFTRALLALKEGKDDPVLKILRAKKFIVASDREYATIRQIAKEMHLF